ncbi:MAG TPA: TetR family transcriptional regulator [Ornithinibacter sp.]|nr:TetR family transcriptional regulator [Ornithinibacter sp.]
MSTSASTGVAPPQGRRRYDSSLRQQMALKNRQAVLDAATARFSESGWAASVRDIARSAGVSVETVYAHFGSKIDLFNTVLDVAVVGDDEPVALVDRPLFAALSTGSHRDRARAGAALNTAINQRTTHLYRALREAAAVEPVLAQRLHALRESQRHTVRAALVMVAGREVTATEADGVWALLTQDVHALLVDTAGWSPAHYEQWVADSILTLLHLHD